MTIPDFLTAEEIAEKCRVSRQTVFNWIDAGTLRAKRLGGEASRTVRIPLAEYQRFISAGGGASS